MKAPRYINSELKLIHEGYFAIYNDRINRWQIRKWRGIYPEKLYLWRELSENIITIRREEYTDGMGLQDAGYMDLDMRTVDAIRKSHWWKLQWKKKIQELDGHNERRERQATAQLEYESKYCAKRIWRSLHEPQAIQDGNWGAFKGE